jgi:hypothetical protein
MRVSSQIAIILTSVITVLVMTACELGNHGTGDDVNVEGAWLYSDNTGDQRTMYWFSGNRTFRFC